MPDTIAKQIGRKALFAFGACLLLGAVIFPFLPHTEYVQQRLELERSGVRTSAAIVAKEALKEEARQDHHNFRTHGRAKGIAGVVRLARAADQAAHSTNGVALIDVYYVDYKFTAKDGSSVDATVQVSREDYAQINVGTDVPVIFHPANPSVSRLPDYSDATIDNGSGASILVSGLLTMAAAWFIGFAWYLSRKVSASAAAMPADGRGMERLNRTNAPAQPSNTVRPAAAIVRTPRQAGFGQRARA